MKVSDRIADLRELHGLTQSELSDILGINRSVLNRMEKGTRPIRDDELKLIADYFNVSADYLLGREFSGNVVTLSDEQKKLLQTFGALKNDAKNTIWTMLNSLQVTHSAAV